MTDAVISTDGLTRTFGKIRAVDGITFQVPEGIIFGFLGPNGSGKTTTIQLLLGLLEPDSGSATVLGHDVRTAGDKVRERTGALLEFSGIYERMSAEDNLELYGRIYNLSSADRKARAKEMLTHLDLWDRRKEPVKNWSRGMKQKLAVARAMFHRPPLIFLDEPTAGLDPVASADLRSDLASVVGREGVTVFLNTHNLAEAEKLCARVGVIRQGKLLAIGSPDELRKGSGGAQATVIGDKFSPSLLNILRRRPDVASVDARDGHLTVGLREDARMAPIVSAIVQAGGEVEEVRRGAASLEDVFLTLVREEGQS